MNRTLVLLASLLAPAIASASATDYLDLDGDGYTAASDCDDNDAEVNPDALEVDDGVDNDCNGYVDELTATDEGDLGVTELGGNEIESVYDDNLAVEDLPTEGPDDDLDGSPTYRVYNFGEEQVVVTLDCDDANPTAYPGATEYFNDIDDDCDGEIDNDMRLDDTVPDAGQFFYMAEEGYGYLQLNPYNDLLATDAGELIVLAFGNHNRTLTTRDTEEALAFVRTDDDQVYGIVDGEPCALTIGLDDDEDRVVGLDCDNASAPSWDFKNDYLSTKDDCNDIYVLHADFAKALDLEPVLVASTADLEELAEEIGATYVGDTTELNPNECTTAQLADTGTYVTGALACTDDSGALVEFIPFAADYSEDGFYGAVSLASKTIDVGAGSVTITAATYSVCASVTDNSGCIGYTSTAAGIKYSLSDDEGNFFSVGVSLPATPGMMVAWGADRDGLTLGLAAFGLSFSVHITWQTFLGDEVGTAIACSL